MACAPGPPSRLTDVGTLLAIDAGNTNVVIGAYRGTELLATWRTATDHDRTEDELAVTLDALLGQEDLSLESMDALVIGSVVPPLTQVFTRLGDRYMKGKALVIGPGVKTGVRLRVDNPSEVGADRIANTLAAHRRALGRRRFSQQRFLLHVMKIVDVFARHMCSLRGMRRNA